MADLETQIRNLADRRFAHTEAVEFTPGEMHFEPQADTPIAATEPINGTDITMHANKNERPRRNWYLAGAAAALVAIAVVGIALVADNDDDSTPPAATPAPVEVELTGAEGDAELMAAFQLILDGFDAFNRGDIVGGPGEAPDPSEIDYVEAAHAAGGRYEMLSCSYDGAGVVEGHVGSSVDGDLITCQTKMVDEFTKAVGLDFDHEFTWAVADGAVLDSVSSYEDLNNMQFIMQMLDRWIEREHPEISFTPIEWYNYPQASEVPAVLEVVDEFVADIDFSEITSE